MLAEKDERRKANRQLEEIMARRVAGEQSSGAHHNEENVPASSTSTYAPGARIRKRTREVFELFSSQASACAGGSSSGGASTSGPSPTMVQQTLYNTPAMKRHMHDAKKKMAEFWYYHMLPLNAFRSSLLMKEMCQAIYKAGPDFKPPSYYEVRTKLLDEVKEDIDCMLIDHRNTWKEKGCTLMCDGWEDKRGRNLLNFMVGSAKGIMFLKSVDASQEYKNAQYLFNLIRECIEDIGPEHVVQVVTDNAASFVAAGRILMASYPTIYWTPCAAHCLDLLLEDIGKINWISMVVRRAKIICKFIYMNSHVRHLFLEFSKGVEIVRPATTRFATNFILLESIQSHKSNLMNMFVSEKYRNDERFARARRLPMGKVAKRAIWDETQFWHGVRNCILITEPLVKVLRIVDGERPSMGFVYEAMERAKDAIKAYMSASRQESDWAHISSLIDKRWNENLHSDLHAAAHVLNPKFGFGKSLLGDAELASGVTNVFHKLESDSRRTIKLMNDLNHYRKKDCPQFLHFTAELAKNEMAPG
eukprot:TRINITY_DN2133_c0_g1_i15.p1 TRINITY_DN2133_c0_g1~~TRINITY_DN2133_c0_g1_i15.p1  ORF type:complete len:532 (-),score=116.96 TRINITY_DN2133_c0_g1_i15:980-2575(-)